MRLPLFILFVLIVVPLAQVTADTPAEQLSEPQGAQLTAPSPGNGDALAEIEPDVDEAPLPAETGLASLSFVGMAPPFAGMGEPENVASDVPHPPPLA